MFKNTNESHLNNNNNNNAKVNTEMLGTFTNNSEQHRRQHHCYSLSNSQHHTTATSYRQHHTTASSTAISNSQHHTTASSTATAISNSQYHTTVMNNITSALGLNLDWSCFLDAGYTCCRVQQPNARPVTNAILSASPAHRGTCATATRWNLDSVKISAFWYSTLLTRCKLTLKKNILNWALRKYE